MSDNENSRTVLGIGKFYENVETVWMLYTLQIGSFNTHNLKGVWSTKPSKRQLLDIVKFDEIVENLYDAGVAKNDKIGYFLCEINCGPINKNEEV